MLEELALKSFALLSRRRGLIEHQNGASESLHGSNE